MERTILKKLLKNLLRDCVLALIIFFIINCIFLNWDFHNFQYFMISLIGIMPILIIVVWNEYSNFRLDTKKIRRGLKSTVFPIDIPNNSRTYYKKTWGFDPITDCNKTGSMWKYEAGFKPVADPTLLAAGVKIYAQVSFRTMRKCRNRIVFRAGIREGVVNCTHTVVYEGTAEKALEWAEMPPRGARPMGFVNLPPYEHFAALKSYVEGISFTGIANMLTIAHKPDQEFNQPFGFNVAMQAQVICALGIVAPKAARAILRDWLMELIEYAPKNWLAQRIQLIVQSIPISWDVVINDIKSEAGDWVQENKEKFDLFVKSKNLRYEPNVIFNFEDRNDFDDEDFENDNPEDEDNEEDNFTF